MSGHSKWHSIKHKKGAEDKRRGKIFTKHAKLIAIAARSGGDPDMNPALRVVIENARAENMPRDNIERAIKKGTGESKDGVVMEEIIYEGFGPGGVALYVHALTDNKNRTVTNLKHTLGKHGGNLGAAGSVGYLFKKHGLILVPATGQDSEKIELAAIDAGAQDIKTGGDLIEIYTDSQDLMKVKKAFEKAGIKVDSARLTYDAQTVVSVKDEATARKILDLIDVIEQDDDIAEVFSNLEIAQELLDAIE